MNPPQRRRFFHQSASWLVAAAVANLAKPFHIMPSRKKNGPIVGHGDFRYRVDKEWGVQDPGRYPVMHCHEMVMDRRGRLLLSGTHTKNNILIYNTAGKVLDSWTLDLSGVHGLTLADEGGEEVLWITDSDNHRVLKTTLDGRVLLELEPPVEIYPDRAQWNPTETAVAPNGDVYVADGYGLNYIVQYDAAGKPIHHWGGKGKEAGQFDCCHGITLDFRYGDPPTLLITSRSTQQFKRFTLNGQYLETIPLGNLWNCRPVIKGNYLYCAIIVTQSWWTYDGMLAILDKENKIVSLPGGEAPTYKDGQFQGGIYDGETFLNPHDVCIDRDDNLYVPQWLSGRTYPVRLERV